jgi:hypothetical protein
MAITEGCHVDNGSQGGIHFDNLTFNVLDNLTFNVQNIEFYIDNLLVAGSRVAAGSTILCVAWSQAGFGSAV